MLRVSAGEANLEVDVAMVNGQTSDVSVSALAFANELVQFATALVSGSDAELGVSRQALLDVAGPEVLVDAAAVAGNFQRMVRIADAMGIPVDSVDNEMSNQIREELSLYQFKSAENSVIR